MSFKEENGTTLMSLAPELKDLIWSFVHESHPSTLRSLALTSRACLRQTLPFTCKRLVFYLTKPESLKRCVDELLAYDSITDCLRYVRELEINRRRKTLSARYTKAADMESAETFYIWDYSSHVTSDYAIYSSNSNFLDNRLGMVELTLANDRSWLANPYFSKEDWENGEALRLLDPLFAKFKSSILLKPDLYFDPPLVSFDELQKYSLDVVMNLGVGASYGYTATSQIFAEPLSTSTTMGIKYLSINIAGGKVSEGTDNLAEIMNNLHRVPRLESIRLDLPRLDFQGCEALLSKLRSDVPRELQSKPKYLEFCYSSFADAEPAFVEWMAQAINFSDLTTLQLRWCPLSNLLFLSSLAPTCFPNLRELIMAGANGRFYMENGSMRTEPPDSPYPPFVFIESLPLLRSLDFDGNVDYDFMLDMLARRGHNLTELRFRLDRRMDRDGDRERGISALKLQRLAKLCPDLITLSVTACREVSSPDELAMWQSFGRFQHLRYLDVNLELGTWRNLEWQPGRGERPDDALGLGRRYRPYQHAIITRSHILAEMRNTPIDEALVRNIWAVITAAQGPRATLKRLGVFPQASDFIFFSEERLPLGSIMQPAYRFMQREWRINRTGGVDEFDVHQMDEADKLAGYSRELGPMKLHMNALRGLSYREPEDENEARRQEAAMALAKEFWLELWPTPEGSENWWDGWGSVPLGDGEPVGAKESAGEALGT